MTKRLLSALAPTVVILAALLACTGDGSPKQSLTPLDTFDPIDADPELSDVQGRLLVLGTDGTISTMNPDGTEQVSLAQPDPDVERRTQPTWSPDGTAVAWTELGTDMTSRLVIAPSKGGTSTSIPSPLLAGYLAWDPTGTRIAMSGNDPDGNLLLATMTPGEPVLVIDQGSPLYFDWSPDGKSLLVHISDRLEYVSVDGSARASVPASGDFRLGAHIGDSVLLGTDRDVGEALAVADRQGIVQRELVRYAAPTAFVIGPDQGKVALMSKGSTDSQRLAAVDQTDLPILEPNRLVVVDAISGSIEEVAQARGVAWFWSPEGERLLYGALEIVDDIERLRWHTWDGHTSTAYRAFTPTGIFGRDYLAFFDQFARSISLWAPDGSAFAYAGGTSLEDVGIWVQPIAVEDPIRVSSGEAVIWSPT